MLKSTGDHRRRTRQLLSISSAAVLCGTFGFAVAASGADTQAAATPDTTPVMAGTLGAASAVQDVSVFMLPSDAALRDAAIGTTLPLTEVIGARTTANANSFTVNLSPEDVPAGALDAYGVGTFTVLVQTDTGTFQTNASARAVVGPDGATQWADPVSPVVTSADGTPAMTSAASTTLPVTAAKLSETMDTTEFVQVSPATARAAQAAEGEPDPPAGCGYEKLDEKVRSATIGTTYPVSEDTAYMEVDSSSGATYGTAVRSNLGGKLGEFKVGESKFTQSGWGFQWKAYNDSRSYRKGIEYGLYELTCVRGCVKCVRTWLPIGETGGTGENRNIPRPDWQVCQPVVAGKWWRDDSDGAAYTNSAAVDFAPVIGIDLSIERQYNSNQRLAYILNTERRLCGDDAFPAKAGRLMARFLND